MQITVDGLQIEYCEQGAGTPVLLLHGWGSSYDVYRGVMANLADRCRVVAVNFPGCGGSQMMATPWDLADYCTFVLHFCAAVGLCNPVLMGHSHGGRVCLQLAASGAMNPPKMVLFDAAGLIPQKTPRQKRRARNFKIIQKICTCKLLEKPCRPLLQKARRHYGSADYNAAPPVLRQTLVKLVNTDLRELLPKILCPTLLVWGDKDTATPLCDGRLMESLIPDAGLCVLEGTGHYSFCEKPAQTNAILRSFIP